MTSIETLLERSRVHPDWQNILESTLARLDQEYLDALLEDRDWLPGANRLLAAFRRDRNGLRYLLIGESPYPRVESANGIAFYDAAVDGLWSEKGLSKSVNRATSLRNIIKTALLAEGHLSVDATGRLTQAAIAGMDKSSLVQTLAELVDNLQQAGFLLLNATPVLHARRKPVEEARYWQGFLQQLLESVATASPRRLRLVLWGKIAQRIEALPASASYDRLACEHPYNISFIDNPAMRELFAELQVLSRPASG